MDDATHSGIRAARAWLRLSDALDAFNRHLREEFGITGNQLAILRIIAEGEATLLGLRQRLAMHPATLGQLVDRLAKHGFVAVEVSATDRRSRRLSLTKRGQATLRDAPVAGPVRLRGASESERLERLTAAFDDAVELFGLTEWAS